MTPKNVIIGEGYTMLDAFRIFSFMYGAQMFDLQIGTIEDCKIKKPYGFVLSEISVIDFGRELLFQERDLGASIRL